MASPTGFAPITDPTLLQQLEGTPPPTQTPAGMAPVDPTTAKFLEGSQSPAILNSPVGGFLRGLRDPIDGAAQLLVHTIQAVAPSGSGMEHWANSQVQDVENTNRTAEQDYDQNWRRGVPPGFDIGRLVGNMAMNTLMGRAFGLGSPVSGLSANMAMGAGVGGLGGAFEPVDTTATPDYWRTKLQQTAGGGAFGALAPAALAGAARVINPNAVERVGPLVEQGVNPTVGQTLGGAVNRIEQGLTSVPVLGDIIKNGRRAAVEQFDRGAINQALAPIGEQLEAPGVGREAIGEMQDKIGAAYDKLVPNLGIRTIDPVTGGPSAAATQLSSDLGRVLKNSAFMPRDNAEQLQSILQQEVFDKMSPGGGMTGESFQESKSALGRMATQYLNSSSAGERQLGGALLQSQVALRDALRVSNPEAADALSKADAAFAQMLRVQNAAAKLGGEPGMFSPAQLQGAVRNLDPSLRKRAFAAGDALMQDYAETGRNVLGSTVPDSGTPFRHLSALGLGMLFGHEVVPPELSAPLIAGVGTATGASLPLYSAPGRWLTTALLARRPAVAGDVANAVRRLGVPAATGAPYLFGNLAPQMLPNMVQALPYGAAP